MRLLIVDDDVPTVEAIQNTIDWEAIEIDRVETAYNAAQARRILKQRQTDIVICDIEMPQGSGLDLLAWVREQKLDVEFLFLTCHERFDYATSALKMDAAEYLSKPFNPKIMALSLQKTIAKIKENRRLKEGHRYGTWRMENLQQEERNFWLSRLNGVGTRNREHIRKEIEARGLIVDADAKYRLIATHITEFEMQEQDLGQELLFYILENAHSCLLCCGEENKRTIRRYGANGLWYFTAVPDETGDVLKERGRQVVAACMQGAQVKATLCIGEAVPIESLADEPAKLQALIERNVAFYTHAFTADEAISGEAESQVLELDKLEGMLQEHDKIRLLNTIKQALSNRMTLKTLSERTLYLIQQELLQAVYAHLADAGIQATRLFADEDSARLSDRACRSTVDMIRWANYLLERTFSFEDELQKSVTLVERIDTYIREHYRENIGRNEIAAAFYLSPEYLAKLYKKKTAKSLKDAIWQHRMEQAKLLLRDPTVRIGDVAGAVGIDNFSYFTTVFKKEIGQTPQEYRRENSKHNV